MEWLVVLLLLFLGIAGAGLFWISDLHMMPKLRVRAEQGHAGAQFSMGLRHENGKGVPKDDEAAAEWYKRAAEQGHAAAQNNLGVMYQDGRGVPQDYEVAAEWYKRAATQDYATAEWHARAAWQGHKNNAKQGIADAQRNLGLLYANGQGVPQSYEIAAEWYKRAVEQGLCWRPEKPGPDVRLRLRTGCPVGA